MEKVERRRSFVSGGLSVSTCGSGGRPFECVARAHVVQPKTKIHPSRLKPVGVQSYSATQCGSLPSALKFGSVPCQSNTDKHFFLGGREWCFTHVRDSDVRIICLFNHTCMSCLLKIHKLRVELDKLHRQ